MKLMFTAAFLAMSPVAAQATEGCLLGATTEELGTVFRPHDERQLTPDEIRRADPLVQQQILSATGTRTLAGAIKAVRRSEDGVIYIKEFTGATLPADFYTVVTYYPGGNEYGAIFEGERAFVVARIGDGDLYECLVH